jgi:GNAT superfamily N-acetyltransferase
VAGTALQVARRIRQKAWASESHVWYALSAGDVPARDLPPGALVLAADEAFLAELAALPTTVTEREARRRLAGGAQLWLVMSGGEPMFGCWLFRESAPVPGAPDGSLDLPEGFIVVEDVVTAEHYRGLGIAPAALATIARRVSVGGPQLLLAKVQRTNRPSRRAFRKAGFRSIARMHRRERGPFTAMHVQPAREHRAARVLQERLSRP